MVTTCINCPMGCTLNVEKKGEDIVVTGNLCIRGVQYGKEEITAPKRVVTSLIKGEGYIYSVKTNISVPKQEIFNVLKEIQKIKLDKNIYEIGDTIKENVLNTQANIVVTGKNKLVK